jgi:hypothetical protein
MEDAGEVSSCSSSEVVWLVRVCVQTSVNTTVVTGLGTNTKCQIPGTRKGALEESEMEKTAAAVRLGSVPTTAQQQRITRQTTGRQESKEGDVALEDWRRLIWNRSLPGRLRALRERLVRKTSILRASEAGVGSQCSGANADGMDERKECQSGQWW